MTCVHDPAEHFGNAHRLIIEAENCWDAGNPAALQECISTLEASAAQLAAAHAESAGHPDAVQASLVEISRIQQSVVRMEGLQGLAAAFLNRRPDSHRGSLFYGPNGIEEAPDNPSHAPTGIQV